MTFKLLQHIPYILLFLSIGCLWLQKFKDRWFLLCVIANFIAWLLIVIDFITVFVNVCMFISIYLYYDSQGKGKIIPALISFFLGLLFLSHNVPGVQGLLLVENIQFSSSIPFDLYFNFDKILLGLLILGIADIQLVTSWQEYKKIVFAIKYELLFLTMLLVIIGFISGFIHFSLKIPSFSIIWLTHNLFSTCLGEEAFFRVFMQTGLIGLFSTYYIEGSIIDRHFSEILQKIKIDEAKIKSLYGNVLPILLAVFLTSLFFGACHYQGGASFMFLSFIAGLTYGWVYIKTGRIEAAVTVHFLVNTVHFFVFTYPQLS